MAGRYVVTSLPISPPLRWVILDREMCAYCSLPDGTGNILPLEWRSRPGAEAWLHRCYQAWERGKVPVPKGWRPYSEDLSPWAVEAAEQPPAPPIPWLNIR